MQKDALVCLGGLLYSSTELGSDFSFVYLTDDLV